jgi:predicted MPP superfamily phosphohydrolase
VEDIIKLYTIILIVFLYSHVSAEQFKIVHVTDTHNLTDETRLETQVTWINDNDISENIKFVIHGGDLIDGSLYGNDNDTSRQQLENASDDLAALDLSYVVSIGNHDYDNQTDAVFGNKTASAWKTAFPSTEFSTKTGFGGIQDAGDYQNMYFTFTVDGETFLVITTDNCPDQDAVDWVESILEANKTKTVILAMHQYMTLEDSDEGTGVNKRLARGQIGWFCANGTISPEEMYQAVLKNYPNILLVVSGHSWDQADPKKVGGSRTVDVVDGQATNQMRANFQMYTPVSGIQNTYMRIITLDTDSNVVQVQSYSPALDEYSPDPRDNFFLSRIMLGATVEGVNMQGVSFN